MVTTALWTFVFLLAVLCFAVSIFKHITRLGGLRRDDGRDYSPKTWTKRIGKVLWYGLGQEKFWRAEQPSASCTSSYSGGF